MDKNKNIGSVLDKLKDILDYLSNNGGDQELIVFMKGIYKNREVKRIIDKELKKFGIVGVPILLNLIT